MDKDEILKVVRHLIGDIDPVADSSIDEKRMQNLHKMTHVIGCLLMDVERVARNYKDSNYSSAKNIGLIAQEHLEFVKTEILN